MSGGKRGLTVPQLGVWGVFITTAVLMSGKVFISFLRFMIERDAQAAWISALLSFLPAAVGLLALVSIAGDQPGVNLVGIMRRALPRPFGFIALLLLGFYFLILAGLDLRQLAEVAHSTVLPEANTSFLTLMLLGLIGYSLYLGIEPLTRIASLFALPMFLGLAAIYGLSVTVWQPGNLGPILGAGPMPVLRDGFLYSSIYIGMYFVLTFATGLPGPKTMRLVGLGALLIASTAIAGAAATSVMVFGYPNAAEFTLPVYQVARVIVLGRFFQRIEPIFTFTWEVSGGIVVMGWGWILLQIAGDLLGVDDRRPLIPPLLALLWAAAVLPQNMPVAIQYDQTARMWGSTLVFGLPLLCWLWWRLVKRRGRT